MRALTGLRQAGLAAQKNEVAGQALEMALSKIHPDPDNARRAEDESSAEGLEQQKELTEDIRKRGVKSPVSLRPHPRIAGAYMLNFGHRRYKGALEAGLATIPCFIDVHFDSYDQVKENLLHRKPSIWALAQFVQRKLAEGQSKAAIAEGLGKTNQNLVTELVALVDAPACLHQAYASGVTSTRTLYDLRRAYEDYPEQTERWCATAERITRETIRAFLDHIEETAVPGPAAGTSGDVADKCLQKTTQSEALRQGDTPAAPALPRATDATSPEPPLAMDRRAPESSLAPTKAAPLLRHDVNSRQQSNEASAPPEAQMSAPRSESIPVTYKGKTATIAQGTTVSIAIDHDHSILTVPLADLVFVRPG